MGIVIGILAAVGAFILGVIGFLISTYNKLVTLKNRYQNAFAQIDVQLTRRYDLIPNLVEIAKGYMNHEKETLEAVINARNTALTAGKAAAANPGDQGTMNNLANAEGQLGGALNKLLMLAEAYPDLKANENMLALQEELTSTENKVAFARQGFNDAVTLYNSQREQFPAMLIAGPAGFERAGLLEITNIEQKRDAPEIKF
jgi:LemA protein